MATEDNKRTIVIDGSNFRGLIGAASQTVIGANGATELTNFDVGSNLYNSLDGKTFGFLTKREALNCIGGEVEADECAVVALTGTLTFTINDVHVTGSGTAFSTEIPVGSYISKAPSGPAYKVLSVESNTALHLCTNYLEETGGGTAGWSSVYAMCLGATDWWEENGFSTSDYHIVAAFNDGTIRERVPSGIWETVKSGLSKINPSTFAKSSLGEKVIISNGWDAPQKVGSIGILASALKDKGGTWTAIATATLTWNGTATVTSSADVTATVLPGDWIRRSFSSVYEDEVLSVATGGLSITLRESSADTGASAAGGAQKALDTTIRARYILSWKGKLWGGYHQGNSPPTTSYRTRLYWSVTEDFDDWSSDGAGFFDITDFGGAITGLASYDDYLFVFREYSIHIYSWVGDIDVPIVEVRKIPGGVESQHSIAYTAEGIIYRARTGEIWIINSSNNINLSSNTIGDCLPQLSPNNKNFYYDEGLGLTVGDPNSPIYFAFFDPHKRYFRYFRMQQTSYPPFLTSYNLQIDKGVWSKHTFVAPNRIDSSLGTDFPCPIYAFPSYYFTTEPGWAFINPLGQVYYSYPQFSQNVAGSLKLGYLHSENPTQMIKINKIVIYVAGHSTSYYLDTTMTVSLLGRKEGQELSATTGNQINSTLWSDTVSLVTDTYPDLKWKELHPNCTASFVQLSISDSGSSMYYDIDRIVVEYEITATS